MKELKFRGKPIKYPYSMIVDDKEIMSFVFGGYYKDECCKDGEKEYYKGAWRAMGGGSPDAGIGPCQKIQITDQKQQPQHHARRRGHTGDPQIERPVIGHHKEQALQQQRGAGGGNIIFHGKPRPELERIEHAGHPLRNPRKGTGYIQNIYIHKTVPPTKFVSASINSFFLGRLMRRGSP